MYSAKIQVCTGSGKSHPPTPVSSQKSSRNGVLFSGLYRWEVRNNIAVETKARSVSLTHVKDFKPRRFMVSPSVLRRTLPAGNAQEADRAI